MSKIYAIRRKSDGMFYRKVKERYGRVVRKPWVKEPEKAWLIWDEKNILRWFLGSNYLDNPELENYEVVEFDLTEVK